MLRMAVLKTWTGLALAAGFAAVATGALAAEVAKESPASEQLAQQARYWEGQNRYDLARENWLKLLRSSPDSPTALAGLANAEAVSGRAAAAQVYLDRLKEGHPNHPDLRRIEAAIRQGSINQDQLNQPRTLARQGKYQEAVEAYRSSFGSEIPGGRLGLEYYQTLAGTENGWEPAKEGIERLAKENSGDAIYQLALAQHLTYRESSRRQGISQLAALAQQPSIAAPAKQAWRQALLWLGAKRGDEALYQDYLKRYGEDAQLNARLASIRAGVAVAARGETAGPREPTTAELRGRVIRQGFEALDNGQLDVAVERFNDATAQFGESADALGGLGIVALRQQNYGEARELLERATAMDRKTSARWSEALSTARFWDTVRRAEATRKAGDNALAERELRRAIAADPKRAATEVSVPLSLADVLVEQGQTVEAEKIYRDVLRRQPDNVDGLRGLIGVLTRTKRLPEAIALADRQPPEIRNQLGSFGVIKAQSLREQAAVAITARDDARAEILLKEALLLDPESPWTRLDLARIYQRQNRVREANTLVDAMLSASGPVQPDVVVIKASLLAEQQDFLAGLQMLEQVPVGSRTPDMTELQKRLWVRYQTQRAGVYSRAGSQQEAQQILSEVEPFVGEMPELLGAMAGAYADLGDEARALRYMRQALARNSQSDAGLRLGYASLLFKLRQDTEFEVVMDDLLRRGGLNEQQNLDLANLRIGYRLRQADLVREEGDLARAYEYLEPLIRVNPNDPRLMMALARLYNDSKDFDKAYVIYERVLQQNGEEIDAYKGAIGAALALNRVDEADALLERAFAVDANNPRLYALAGRAAKARGDSGRALGLFQQALRLDAEQNAQSAAASPSGSGNSQPLLQLIDPGSSYLRAPPRVTGSASVPEPPMRQASAGSFFKTALGRAPGSRPAWLERAEQRIALDKVLRQLGQGDLALPALHAMQRYDARGFVKVSTPVTVPDPAPVPRGPSADRPTGYWTEQPRSSTAAPSYKYVESLSIQQMGRPSTPPPAAPMAAPMPAYRSDFPPPRRSTPVMSQRLSRPSGSLSDELRGEIDSVGGNVPPGSYTTAPRRSGVYEVPRLDEGYTVPYGGTVDYVPPPPPSTIRSAPRSVVVSDDPMLATPEFVIDRNRVDSKDRKELLKEISELRASRTPYAQAGLTLRTRDGSEGLDKLYNVESPVEVAFPATDAGRFKVRAVPVYLDAGTVSGANLPVYGGLGLALATGVAAPTLRYDNSETGVAVGVGYEAGDFKADFGSSPLGFPVETLVGGVNWRPKNDNVSFKIDLARRNVTDSLLSYAGLVDPATGFTYGGVTKTGGRLDVALDLGKYGVYGNGSYNIYDGENVPQNNSVEIGGGLYARAIETRSNRVTYGLNITGFGYEKNLRRFSFGHGGYFSPQSYLAVSVPVEWEGYRNRFSYKLGGALGIQSFEEDGQSQYPGDSGLQAALDAALLDYTGELVIPGGYPSQSQTGVGFTLGGQFEYLLDPNLALGARLALDNARDYNEASASAYLRYMFYPQKRVSFPPNLLLPNFNFGDPRL